MVSSGQKKKGKQLENDHGVAMKKLGPDGCAPAPSAPPPLNPVLSAKIDEAKSVRVRCLKLISLVYYGFVVFLLYFCYLTEFLISYSFQTGKCPICKDTLITGLVGHIGKHLFVSEILVCG